MIRVLIIAVALATSSAAFGEPAAAQAEVLFRQGRDLMAAGKIAEACSAFAESQKLEPAVTTLLNLAGCREKQGELATAWGLFLDAERQTRSASDAAGQQLHTVALNHSRKLEPRVSKLAINVPQQSQIDGLEIARGGEHVDAAMWNRALPIDGGTYTITAHAPGTSTWSTEVTVGSEGDTKTVDIPDLRGLPRDLGGPATSKPAPPAPASPAAASPPAEAPPPAHAPSKLVPLVVGGGGIALLAGALAFDLSGDSTYSDAKNEMTSQARRDSLYNSANTKRYVAQGLAVGGLAAVGIATYLLLHHHDSAAAEVGSRVVISPSGLALTGSF